MRKRVLAFIFAAFMALSLTACGGGSTAPDTQSGGAAQVEETQPQTPPDLTGEWVQVDGNSEDTYQTATISGNTITVNWVTKDSTALYWAGTFEPPASADEPYTWESKNDTEKTSLAIMASSDETKTFTYEDGKISYDVSAMGVTTKVKLEKK